MRKPLNSIFVIFGASGDLTHRKLIPSLFSLYVMEALPEKFAIVGASIMEMNKDSFRQKMREGISEHSKKNKENDNKIDEFLNLLHYVTLDKNNLQDYEKLKNFLEEIDKKEGLDGNYLFYFAVPSTAFGSIATNLSLVGLNNDDKNYRRIIVEKPFGHDFDSAQKLNKELTNHYKEKQIYRIDHYLGKETVQNLFVIRFANGIFEPLWNRNYIHHVEITSAENIGIENRGRYYDSAGALRDMLQNHLLQELTLMAMEPPSSVDAESIRNEKLKILQSLRPLKEEEVYKQVIRGQYIGSTIKGNKIKGYREENDVAQDSRTETYVAMKLYIDNWRWGGIPFYLRTGKRLPTMVNEIVIYFKPTPHPLFQPKIIGDTFNQLVLRIQPDEGVLMKYLIKTPEAGFQLRKIDMDFHYKDLNEAPPTTAYERLLYDALHGDSTLFLRDDAVEASWKFVEPVLNAWQNDKRIKIYGYPGGTWGPENADELIEEKKLGWRYPCKNLTDEDLFCEL